MDSNALLLLPAGAAVMYVVAAVLLKRAISAGSGQGQVNLYVNLMAAVLFLPLWLVAGPVDWSLVWMPLVAAVAFLLGQIFTFQALRHGDVSVATPLLGMKVLFIAVTVSVFFGETVSLQWWIGAAASSLGVIFVTGATLGTLVPRLLQRDAVMSLAAAAAFAVTDVLVQQWAPRFGAPAFISTMFGVVGVVSVVLFVPREGLGIFWIRSEARGALIGGAVVLSVQALGMALALSHFGNATALNIVYSSRAIWSVLLAGLAAKYFASSEREVSREVMGRRLLGSILLFAAVVLVLI